MRPPYAAVAAPLGCGLLNGCGVLDEVTSRDCEDRTDDCSHVVVVRGAHAHFSVRVPETRGIGSAREDDVCDSASYRFDELPDVWGRLQVEAVPSDCDVSESSSSIGNGTHGTYRTIDDVPEPEDVASVDTALGEATVFTQEYFECTNSCDRWQEPVAIVTLDAPVDPGYPTLVLRGEQDRLSRAALEAILGDLKEPYPPPSESATPSPSPSPS